MGRENRSFDLGRLDGGANLDVRYGGKEEMSNELFTVQDADGSFKRHSDWRETTFTCVVEAIGPFIMLEKANRLLRERGKVVWQSKGFEFWGDIEVLNDPVKALLINIEPVTPPDSAEKILKDLVFTHDKCEQFNHHLLIHSFIDRAKKLIGGEK